MANVERIGAPDAIAAAGVSEPRHVRRRLYTAEIKGIWNLGVIKDTLGTRQQCIEFCENNRLIPTSKICYRHNTPMRIYLEGQLCGFFCCCKTICKGKKWRRQTNTWFENVKISLPRVFYLMYAFSQGWTYDMTKHEDYTSDSVALSQRTIADWFSYCREAIVIDYLDYLEFRGMIGGPGIVVHIGKSKFGKRKLNRGHRIDGHWVLGMVQEGTRDIRLEVCPDNESADVLIPLIVKHVAPGSIIHTDSWKAYNNLGNFCLYGYTHKRGNHSDPENQFVAEGGTHTQRIEGQWSIVKKYFHSNVIPSSQFADFVVEYQWRYHQKVYKRDKFKSLLETIQRLYPIH